MANPPMPEPSKTRVNACGDRLREFIFRDLELTSEQLGEEARIVWAWRRQHSYPLRLTIPSLRNWTARYSTAGITPAERLKRFRQILIKLNRQPGMKLARMQDIAGCRAILGTAQEVEQLHQVIVEHWQPVRTSDYRRTPRSTGYRGLHLIVAKRRAPKDDELRLVEIQLRTMTEHRWAETVMHTGNRLTFGLQDGQGPPELVEYFRLASDVLYAADNEEDLGRDLGQRFSEVREQVRTYFERT